MHFERKILSNTEKTLDNHNRSCKDLDRRLREEADAQKQETSSVSSVGTYLDRIIKHLKFIKDRKPYLAKQLDSEARQEIEDQVESMIEQWDNALEDIDRAIKKGDRFLSTTKQIEFEDQRQTIESRGHPTHNKVMKLFQEINFNANDLLQSESKVMTLGKHIDDCHKDARELKKLAEDLNTAVEEAQNKEEEIEKKIAKIEDSAKRDEASAYNREIEASRLWINGKVRDISTFSPTLRQLGKDLKELRKQYERTAEPIKNDSDKLRLVQAKFSKQYNDKSKEYDATMQTSYEELHRKRLDFAKEFDDILDNFKHEIISGNLKKLSLQIWDVLSKETELFKELNDEGFFKEALDTLKSCTSGKFYIEEAYNKKGEKIRDIIHQEGFHQLPEDLVGIQIEVLRSSGDKTALDRFKEIKLQYFTIAKKVADHLKDSMSIGFTNLSQDPDFANPELSLQLLRQKADH